MMDYLEQADQSRLNELRAGDPFVEDALRQLDRILASRKFERVQQKARDFLGFVVAMTLLGKDDQIKETTLAIAVFGESADFNPAETSKVRVAAADLRQRLAAYAEHEGRDDVIQILIPLNTYVPDIRDRRVPVAITEFENWHPHGEQQYLCAVITAEIAHQLGKAGLRAGRAETLQKGSTRCPYTLRGSVENRDDVLRVNVSLADPSVGRILCSRSFEASRDDVLKLTREVIDALLAALAQVDQDPRPVRISSRRRS